MRGFPSPRFFRCPRFHDGGHSGSPFQMPSVARAHRVLTFDSARILVVSETEIDWLTKFAVRRPFGELDLGDERRAHPVRPSVRLGSVQEWATVGLERYEKAHETRELAIVE